MYKGLINSEVAIIVASITENLIEYTDMLCEEDENLLKLKNVEMNLFILTFPKNKFGSSLGSFKQNIEEVILNKEYIIFCSKK